MALSLHDFNVIHMAGCVSVVLLKDYGLDWRDMNEEWIVSFIHDAAIDQMTAGEIAFRMANAYQAGKGRM